MISRIPIRYLRSTPGHECPRGGIFRRRGWILLETVLATGLLIFGLSLIGVQMQDASVSIRKMELELRAMALAELKLAELDLGLVELDSFDEVQEEEFGPRYPEFGWRLTTEETGLEGMFLLTLDVLFQPREPGADDDYREGDFDFDTSDEIFTIFAFRATPVLVDLGEAFGLEEEEFDDLCERLSQLGIPGTDCESFDFRLPGKLPIDDLLKLLAALPDAFNIDIDALTGALPPGMMDLLEQSGVLDELQGDTSDEEESGS